jgi:hypothetical protein
MVALLAQLALPAADARTPRPDGKPADMTKKVKVFILLGQSMLALLKNQPEPAGETSVAPGAGAAIPRETRDISGWQVHISRKLLEAEPDATACALTGLKKMLDEIGRVVPASALTELRKVPLYFSSAYRAGRSGAEFHPDAGWLRDNGRDPAMARGVEFSGVDDFEAEMRRMPNFALHELAHAYHFRALKGGFDNADIKAAYERAKASGSYDRVERSFGEGNGKPNTFERAYAMTNPMEYFAETTEAYFSRNDFFPFTREQLKQHDPAMFTLLGELWGAPEAKLPQPAVPAEEDVAFFEKKYQKKITGVKPKNEYSDPDQFYSAIGKQLGIPEIAWKAAAEKSGWKKDDGKHTFTMLKGGTTAGGGQGTWDVLFIRSTINPETKKPDPATMEQVMVQIDYDGNITFPEIPKGHQ